MTTRPDAVVVHFGHNNVWDIRIAEDNSDRIGAFNEVLDKVKAIPTDLERIDADPWYVDYCKVARENYAKPYPRPFPCGSLLLGFDRRRAELSGHRLDLSNGMCEVLFLVSGRKQILQIFTDMVLDRLWLRVLDSDGKPCRSPFNRIRLLPDPEAADDMPPITVTETGIPAGLSFRQVLPAQIPEVYNALKGHPEDRAVQLTVWVSSSFQRTSRKNWYGVVEEMGDLERALTGSEVFLACVQLDEGPAGEICQPTNGNLELSNDSFETARSASDDVWREYWSRSAVLLEDKELEWIWYRNMYFYNCCVKPGAFFPGLYGNWSYKKIGTAWHGDYHLDYNTQQATWAVFSSNHVDKHLGYVDMVHSLLPLGREIARNYFGMRGAYFPVSAYPIKMSKNPYPALPWAWQICVTPWTVQSLWWHYAYTMDREFLERRAFEPIREAVLFLTDYMLREETYGLGWGDDRYHVFPTVPTELYGITPGLTMNRDALCDLTLTRFIFHAYLTACEVLDQEASEHALIAQVEDILNHYPEYPTTDSEHGKIFVSVPGESTNTVYNCPISTMPVFPGEEIGIGSPPEEYEIAANSYRTQRNEGGNDLVHLNIQAARLGLLDLDRFKRQISYATYPNGAAQCMVMQVYGRYDDMIPFDFMGRMGIWVENFALPAVINECLFQSWDGTMRFFPNWPASKSAEFHTLRAVGGFLVSAAFRNGEAHRIEIFSEAGSMLRMQIPWPSGACVVDTLGERVVPTGLFEQKTTPGETIRLSRADM